MTAEQSESLRASLYIVAGLLAGIGLSSGFFTTSPGRAFLDPAQFPQPARQIISMMLIVLGSIIICWLRRGLFASGRSDKSTQQADRSRRNT